MFKNGLYYSETDKCFSGKREEGFRLVSDLGAELNKRFFYECEIRFGASNDWPDYEGVIWHFNDFILMEIDYIKDEI